MKEAQISNLEKGLQKYVVAHTVQDDTYYIYFLGLGNFSEDIAWSNEQKRHYIPRIRVMNMVQDGKLLYGFVSMSTRVISHALQKEIFEDWQFSVSIFG